MKRFELVRSIGKRKGCVIDFEREKAYFGKLHETDGPKSDEEIIIEFLLELLYSRDLEIQKTKKHKIEPPTQY